MAMDDTSATPAKEVVQETPAADVAEILSRLYEATHAFWQKAENFRNVEADVIATIAKETERAKAARDARDAAWAKYQAAFSELSGAAQTVKNGHAIQTEPAPPPEG